MASREEAVALSRPEVGSSRMRMLASVTSSVPMLTLLISPPLIPLIPEKPPICLSLICHTPSSCRTAFTCFCTEVWFWGQRVPWWLRTKFCEDRSRFWYPQRLRLLLLTNTLFSTFYALWASLQPEGLDWVGINLAWSMFTGYNFA